MPSWDASNAAWLHLSCYGLAVASAVLPWLNAEVIVLAFAAMATSRADLVALAVLATAGQVTGKGLMYWTGRGAALVEAGGTRARLDKWRARLERHRWHPLTWVFVSAVVGVPPLYIVTVLAGAAKVPFGRFLAVTSLGRLLHFGMLVLAIGVR
jgi:membrane protein YqaA with SNARE-associated domain